MEAEARQRFKGSRIRVQVQCRVGRWALPLLLGTSSLWVKSLALLYTVISLFLSFNCG